MNLFKTFDLNSIQWQEISEDGSRYALLEGDKTLPSTFSYAYFLPAGVWDKPHWHTGDAYIFVLQGELHLALSKKFEISNATRYPAGSLICVPKDTIHFDGAEMDTLILGIASGPWGTHYL